VQINSQQQHQQAGGMTRHGPELSGREEAIMHHGCVSSECWFMGRRALSPLRTCEGKTVRSILAQNVFGPVFAATGMHPPGSGFLTIQR
jgi:hypothetical protein